MFCNILVHCHESLKFHCSLYSGQWHLISSYMQSSLGLVVFQFLLNTLLLQPSASWYSIPPSSLHKHSWISSPPTMHPSVWWFCTTVHCYHNYVLHKTYSNAVTSYPILLHLFQCPTQLDPLYSAVQYIPDLALQCLHHVLWLHRQCNTTGILWLFSNAESHIKTLYCRGKCSMRTLQWQPHNFPWTNQGTL
jgi:hypothetical protein